MGGKRKLLGWPALLWWTRCWGVPVVPPACLAAPYMTVTTRPHSLPHSLACTAGRMMAARSGWPARAPHCSRAGECARGERLRVVCHRWLQHWGAMTCQFSTHNWPHSPLPAGTTSSRAVWRSCWRSGGSRAAARRRMRRPKATACQRCSRRLPDTVGSCGFFMKYIFFALQSWNAL